MQHEGFRFPSVHGGYGVKKKILSNYYEKTPAAPPFPRNKFFKRNLPKLKKIPRNRPTNVRNY
jgi:hypothetical protein